MPTPHLDKNTVYLVDGSGYIFRAFFAIRSLRSKSGVPTNAVYGFTNMLIKLLKEHRPAYIGIAFDRKEPTFRHKIFPAYKALRPLPPEDLVPQFALIHRVVNAFNIKLMSEPGFEADDLIGTMSRRAHEAGHQVVIVTGDKDLMQLVDEKTLLLDELRAMRNGGEIFIDEAYVKKEFDVYPKQVIDLLALAGDASDNVPGVSGIGKKTAAELINEFGSLEKIISLTPLIKQKSRREKIIEGQNQALLSKQLVTIDQHVPFVCSVDDLKFNGVDREKTTALFLELDFNRLLNDQVFFQSKLEVDPIGEKKPDYSVVDPGQYLTITSTEQFKNILPEIKKASRIAIATCTDSLNSNTAELKGVALAWDKNRACFIPRGLDADWHLDENLITHELNQIFSDERKTIVAENAKFHHKVLSRYGWVFAKVGGDPLLANYLLQQEDQIARTLFDLSHKHLHYAPSFLKDKNAKLGDLPLKTAALFSLEEADLVWRLEEQLVPLLKNASLLKLYHELELPLEEVLSRMEVAGVKIDVEVLHQVGQELKSRLQVLEGEAHALAGEVFNLSSPKKTAEILFDKLKLPTAKKTKTGYSTDSSVLEKLQSVHPIAKVLLEHRMCAKLINTYVDILPSLVNPKTGRLHTNYNQFVTATGRLSSSDPNLQNIPARTKEGRKIRRAFVAKPGYRLISLDYSQVELRLLALVSKDPVLLDSFAKDQDVHRRTASEIFEVASDQVSKMQRNAAKTINFGLLYGMGVHRLSQTLGIPRKEAQIYLEKYFKKHAGILSWKNEVLTKARELGEVRTLFGRRRALPEFSSKHAVEQARGERIAINTPIQGTAADIIKFAMIAAEQYLKKNADDAHLILQVHDELVIEAKAEQAQKIAEDVAKIMSEGHGLPLHLKVDYGIADNWDDAH